MVFIVFSRDSWDYITHKYPLYRAYIGISHRGTLGSGYILAYPKKQWKSRPFLPIHKIHFFTSPSFWANYSDLSRGHPKWWFSKGIPSKIPLNSGLGIIVVWPDLSSAWPCPAILPVCQLYQSSWGTNQGTGSHESYYRVNLPNATLKGWWWLMIP